MIESLHFLRPWWLLALLALPLLGMVLYRRVFGGGAWQQFIDPALLPHVLEHGPSAGTRWGLWLGLPGAALAIIALAGPAWERLPQPVFHGQSPLVLAMDLSRSMDAADVPPSRVARARLKVLDILNQRKDGQTALVAFAGDAFVVSPLTDDAATIASMVPSLETTIMPAQGSNVTAALEEATALLDQAGATRGDVLLLTDSPAEPETLQAARRLTNLGHRLSVLAIGTREGAPVMLGEGRMLRDRNGNIVVSSVDTESLASLAMAGSGAFSGLTVDDTDLARLLPDSTGFADAVEAQGDIRTDQWREEGPWLLLPLLPLAALLFRRGVIVCLLIMCAPWPVHAAGTLSDGWASLWQRADQRGAALFDAEQPEQAATAFQDAEWRAAANFRAGNFAQSATDLDGVDTPRGNYNRGNALAMSQDIGGAIAAYERTLELEPDHDDARHNLEQLLKQQEQQQQQQGEGESDDSSEQDSESQQQDSGEQGQDGEQGEQGQQPQDQSSDPSDSQQAQDGDSQQGSDSESEQDAQEAENAAADEAEQDGDAEDEAERRAREAQLAAEEMQDEERQSAELWLRRIPDDPGGLLRRKLLYQHRQRDRRGETEDEPW
ncbi:MAG: VWA domain-containing protein [Pseudomonadota bacterium]